MTDALLIPTAILVPDELRLDIGAVPTGIIPLHGKPMLHHIVDTYEDVRPYVACHRRADRIAGYVERNDLDWDLVDVGETASLGETVAAATDEITARYTFGADDRLFVNFADTMVVHEREDAGGDFVSYATVCNPVRWTSFAGEAHIRSVEPKDRPKVTGDTRVFTGAFGIVDPDAFGAALAEALRAPADDGLDPFYGGLVSYLAGRPYDLLAAAEWIDAGHLDTYYRAKKQFLNVREFNAVSVDEERNVLTKTSERVDTLRAEYAWYTSLSEALQPFAPQVYGFDEASGRLDLEYVGYPSLRDIHLYGSHGLHIWNRIFETLFSMLGTFADYRTDEGVEAALREMYLDKTVRRLERVDPDGHLAHFFADTVTVNGTDRPGVPRILDGLEASAEAAGLFDIDEFTILHGDLCLSNVLYAVRNGIVKLIDPRGEFGQHVIYGDQRYDLAKLRHSVAGNYEFVINDMFEVTTTDAVEYRVHRDDDHDERELLLDQLLDQRYPDWADDVRRIESLLFLSMVPLHADAPDRQQYMLARGVEQFDEHFGQ
jgi:hypothetical protein